MIAALGLHQGLRDIAGCGKWVRVMEILTAEPGEIDVGLLAIACQQGSLEFISWAHDHPNLYPLQQSLPDEAVAKAIQHGHAHILEWICDKLPHQQVSASAIKRSLIRPANQGDLRTLQLAFKIAQVQEVDDAWMFCLYQACAFSDSTPSRSWYSKAAKRQHLQVICWLGRHLQSAFDTVFDTYWPAGGAVAYGTLDHFEERKINGIMHACDKRTVPLQLAAEGKQLRIPWNNGHIHAAYKWGDKKVLLASHSSFESALGTWSVTCCIRAAPLIRPGFARCHAAA